VRRYARTRAGGCDPSRALRREACGATRASEPHRSFFEFVDLGSVDRTFGGSVVRWIGRSGRGRIRPRAPAAVGALAGELSEHVSEAGTESDYAIDVRGCAHAQGAGNFDGCAALAAFCECYGVKTAFVGP